MQIALRAASPADADAVAALHVEVWRRTYRALAPPAAFQSLDFAARQRTWRGLLAAPKPGSITLLAERDGALAGFVHGGAPGDPAYGELGEVLGEVKYLYVATAFARQGIGRRLLAAMAGRLVDLGYRGIGLGVVVGNDQALAFYRALGGRVIGRYADPGPLWRSENQLCAWDDATVLTRLG